MVPVWLPVVDVHGPGLPAMALGGRAVGPLVSVCGRAGGTNGSIEALIINSTVVLENLLDSVFSQPGGASVLVLVVVVWVGGP